MNLKAEQLTIIDKPGEFLLKIGDAEIPFVTGYAVTSDVEKVGFIDLVIKVAIPVASGYGMDSQPDTFVD